MEKPKIKAKKAVGTRAAKKVSVSSANAKSAVKKPSKKLNKQDEIEDADHLTINQKVQITNSEEQRKTVNSVGNAHDEEDEESEDETASDYRDIESDSLSKESENDERTEDKADLRSII